MLKSNDKDIHKKLSGTTICNNHFLMQQIPERKSGAQLRKNDNLVQQFLFQLIWYNNLQGRRSGAQFG